MHTHTHSHMHTKLTHTQTHTRTRTHIITLTHTHAHTTHTCTYTQVHTLKHTMTHTHAHTHTHVHTCTYTLTHVPYTIAHAHTPHSHRYTRAHTCTQHSFGVFTNVCNSGSLVCSSWRDLGRIDEHWDKFSKFTVRIALWTIDLLIWQRLFIPKSTSHAPLLQDANTNPLLSWNMWLNLPHPPIYKHYQTDKHSGWDFLFSDIWPW
jgi:hypothetical protein